MQASGAFIAGVLRRRLLIMGLCLGLLVLGYISFNKLPIEPYPNISPLNVQVITQWPGRGTNEIERQITVPVETSLANLPHLKTFRSVSLFGLSVVTLQFEDGTDSFTARQNVQLQLDTAELPEGIQSELSPDADALGEVLRYRVASESGDDVMLLKSYQDWEIYRQLKTVPGIADINGFGGPTKQYQVLPDVKKLQAYNISLNQLVEALGNANANAGGGNLRSGEQQYVVRGIGLVKTLEDVSNIVIVSRSGIPVRVGDVASVEFGYAPRLGVVQYNDNPDAVEGIVLMRRGGNASEMLERVHSKVDQINSSGLLPEGIHLEPFYDRQELLDLTMGTVHHTLLFGMALVLVVLFVFLGSLRAAIAVAIVIPLALSVSFAGMVLAIPANLISLGAIDFGLIVDAAVIVIENIMRRMENGSSNLRQTIVAAAAEVQRPMIFSTMIIIMAYAPLFIMGGVEGKIFHPMAYTMGLALLASMILSLTFIPSAASFLFKPDKIEHRPGMIGALIKVYRPLLAVLLRKPGMVAVAALLAFGIALVGASRLGTSFLPTLEENNLWVRITLPNTVDLHYSSDFASRVRGYLLKQPEVKTVVGQIGRPDDGTDATGVFNVEFGVYLKKPEEWAAGVTRDDLVKRVEGYLQAIPGIEYNFSQYIQDNVAEALSGVKGENSVKIFGDDLEVLHEKALQVQSILRGIDGMTDVGIFRELGQPTMNIRVNREASARFGLNVADIQNLVINAIGGSPVSKVLEGERSFDLALRFPEAQRNRLDLIQRLLVDTPDGQRIPLSMVATVELSDGPFFIYRESGRRYIAIRFGVRDRDLGSAAAEAQKLVSEQVDLPRGYKTQWDGQFNQMQEAHKKLAVIVPLTLLAIFIMLYSAFGSAKDASLVLLNVPFATIGGIAALYLAGEELSISAGIGFLSLFGIAIQDGVILISYIKSLYNQGEHGLQKAILEGASMRLRPVLMTAMLAGLGLLPAALSQAIGSQAQRPLALVIVGGMVTTTILTLLVLPVVFGWIYRHYPNSSRTESAY
ncbi:CusA/CzcA family heavy metal efflux RND transporter [Methylobacillus gramineus]|uniref:efflux RND transporter permease subunit n=1 Tax=Methylobacillus gramineus TaxID=755169 RepID=UPI001CFF9078|nr:CusA/CzcA family heavy metal efflux RND transporter [Methylobacillus gramineus]MCB5184223.1 CusA/CzcA family heavy metal efflux RND transporter [Methylobacillus gramineus]